MGRAAQRTRAPSVNGNANGATSTTLRADVADALERLSQMLVAHASTEVMATEPVPNALALEHVRETVRFLGQVVAAWDDVPDTAIVSSGAGFGSAVLVEDLDDGSREMFTLMAGPLIDFDAGHVSLASPIGQVLLGAEAGDIVSVQTPQRLRRLRVLQVQSLQGRIADGLAPSAV